MKRSTGIITCVKVPINWDSMTDQQKTRLSQITGRDTRVIAAYLGVIERHEKELRTGKRGTQLDPGRLNELTLTALRGKNHRTSVVHDFKARFPRISVNEFGECRDTAIAMWSSYLERAGAKPLKSENYRPRKIPRCVFPHCFSLVYSDTSTMECTLYLRDSLDSRRNGRGHHDKLSIPLSVSSYHASRMKQGQVKTVKILKDFRHKWWALFSVDLEPEQQDSRGKPPAVLAIDLGVNKAACTVLLTQHGFKQVRYWKQNDKLRHLTAYDETIAALQKASMQPVSNGGSPQAVVDKLSQLGHKRANVSSEYDREMIKSISEHILDMNSRYDLYVAIGRLRGIRNRARKGNFQGSAYRKMIHRWSFGRVSTSLEHKLTTLGFDARRFRSVPEAWTSRVCHKCGHFGYRPKQSLFVCGTCGYHANADLNAAINIGRRLITLIPSLRDETKGLGMWLPSPKKATPNAQRGEHPRGKSLLSQRLPASPKGESVADDCTQTPATMFECDEDPAMVKTVEEPSAAGSMGSPGTNQQRQETTCREGTTFQKSRTKLTHRRLDLSRHQLVTAVVRMVEHRSPLC